MVGRNGFTFHIIGELGEQQLNEHSPSDLKNLTTETKHRNCKPIWNVIKLGRLIFSHDFLSEHNDLKFIFFQTGSQLR